jgi:hypothetical protein
MELTLSQWLVIGICAILVLGYIFGYYYNRQQAGRIQTWLRSSLEKWGPVSLGDKLPGMVTGGRLTVKKAAEPFQQIEAIYLLAPRENLLFWLFHLLQGRGDELVLRIWLPKVPKAAMGAKRDWRSKYTYQGEGAEEKLGAFLSQHRGEFFHLALRREAPHLFVRATLPTLMADNSGGFLASLVELTS